MGTGNMTSITYETIKDAVNTVDPLGLLNMGCPDDEYDVESENIYEIIKDKNEVELDREDLVKIIKEVFFKWFNITANDISNNDYEKIVDIILN